MDVVSKLVKKLNVLFKAAQKIYENAFAKFRESWG